MLTISFFVNRFLSFFHGLLFIKLSHRSPCWDSLTVCLGEAERWQQKDISRPERRAGSREQIGCFHWGCWESKRSILHLHSGSARHETELHSFLLEVAQVQPAQRSVRVSVCLCTHRTLTPPWHSSQSQTLQGNGCPGSHLLQDSRS